MTMSNNETTVLLNLILLGLWILTAVVIGKQFNIDSRAIDFYQMIGLIMMTILVWNNNTKD